MTEEKGSINEILSSIRQIMGSDSVSRKEKEPTEEKSTLSPEASEDSRMKAAAALGQKKTYELLEKKGLQEHSAESKTPLESDLGGLEKFFEEKLEGRIQRFLSDLKDERLLEMVEQVIDKKITALLKTYKTKS